MLSPHKLDSLRAVAEEAAAEHGVPGVSVWLCADGEDGGFQLGVTSVDNPLPVDGDTLFQAGSITKTVTATAAVRLSQAGRLDLDAPVRRYLPALRLADEDVAAKITTRDLLSHGGGFVGDWFDDLGWGDDAVARFVTTFDRLPQLTPLRSVWSYNNAGFVIAGHVLEVVAGKPYEEVVREHVLPDAVFFPWVAMLHRFAVGHVTEGDEVRTAEPWAVPRASAPAGGLVTSARRLVDYARRQMEDASLAPLREPQLESQPGEWMGLAWFLKDRQGVSFADHGGTTNGQCAWLALAPERGFAIAVLTNHQHGHALVGRLLERAFEDWLGVTPWQPDVVDLSRDRLAEYAGRYETPLDELVVRLDDGTLMLELVLRGGFPTPDSPPRPGPPPAPVAFHGEDQFHVTDGVMRSSRGEFLRDGDGRIAWLRFGRRIHAPVPKS